GGGEATAARRAAPPARLRRAAPDTRQGMRDLRSLIVEIAPPNLREEGLDNALDELLAPLAASGVETSVAIDENVHLSAETEALLYRVAQEAVRNATSHAAAHR